MILLYDDPSLCSCLLFASQGAGPALLVWVHRKLRSRSSRWLFIRSFSTPIKAQKMHQKSREPHKHATSQLRVQGKLSRQLSCKSQATEQPTLRTGAEMPSDEM